MIDTHTHLYLPDFNSEEGRSSSAMDGQLAVVERAFAARVEQMIFPNVDCETIEPMKALARKFPGKIYCAMGLHPTEVKESWREDLDVIMSEFSTSYPYVAVGEVGIDLYWDKTFEQEQMSVFDKQLTKADEKNMPVIIHCREGLEQTLDVLSGHKDTSVVFHSFGGTIEDVERIRKCCGDNCRFGINGVVTFKNSRLRDVIPAIGIENILTETDAPYLAPVPYRGKRNESAYMLATLRFIADTLAIPFAEADKITTANARAFFSLSK